jgi:hypothetical protein
MAIVDLSTQVYQAVLAQLMNYAPLAQSVRTVQDLSQAAFQQLVASYSSGDAPAMLLLPTMDIAVPFRENSMEMHWNQSFSLLITTDSQQIGPVNGIKWLIRYAMCSGDPHFGLGGMVEGWEWASGQMGMGPWQRWLDAATSGSKRWATVEGFRVSCGIAYKGQGGLYELAAAATPI